MHYPFFMVMLSEFLATGDGLTVEALYALVRLSECGTLTEAAGGKRQQSKYSKYLQKLSEFFGTPLTEKHGRVCRLSPAGEELAKLARAHLTALSDFKRRASADIPSYVISSNDSLIQGLLIPALAQMPRGRKRSRFRVVNRRTSQVVADLNESRSDFGLLRANAVPGTLESKDVCVVRHIVVIPRRLITQRRSPRLREALLEMPHACVTGDGELVQKIQELARGYGGQFQPELECDSHGQCLAAVRCGTFAAIVPRQAWEPRETDECEVIDDEPQLDGLDRVVALAWLPRKLSLIGTRGAEARDDLLEWLGSASEQRGMIVKK